MPTLRCRTLLFLVSATLVAGCARPRAALVTPSPEELPRFEHREPTLPASVTAEGAAERSAAVLVPSFQEPELTAAERAALGEEKERINWLEFYHPLPKLFRITPDTGGVSTTLAGRGGAAVGFDTRRPVSTSGPDSGGAHTGALTEGTTRFQSGGRAQPASASGPRDAVRVGEGGTRRAATRQTRRER